MSLRRPARLPRVDRWLPAAPATFVGRLRAATEQPARILALGDASAVAAGRQRPREEVGETRGGRYQRLAVDGPLALGLKWSGWAYK